MITSEILADYVQDLNSQLIQGAELSIATTNREGQCLVELRICGVPLRSWWEFEDNFPQSLEQAVASFVIPELPDHKFAVVPKVAPMAYRVDFYSNLPEMGERGYTGKFNEHLTDIRVATSLEAAQRICKEAIGWKADRRPFLPANSPHSYRARRGNRIVQITAIELVTE